jgi:hypothetical protein
LHLSKDCREEVHAAACDLNVKTSAASSRLSRAWLVWAKSVFLRMKTVCVFSDEGSCMCMVFAVDASLALF